jgi:murein DD-endopeptidase MepM/ murein hydrolase activator NlpD
MRTPSRRMAVDAVAAVVLVLIAMASTGVGAQAETTPPPTPDPLPSATPTPTPTTPPAPPPTTPPPPPEPTQPPPTADPTSPPADPVVPTEPADELSDDSLSEHAHDVMSAHADLVTEAQALLDQALANLTTAEAAVAKAVADANAARDAHAEALRELEQATRAEQRAERQLGDILEQITDTKDDLGAMARDAYQSGGLATLSVVLEADTPAEYADTYVGMRTVLRASDSTLGDLAVRRADLADARERLQDLREDKEAVAEQAAQSLAAKESAKATAAAARRDLSEAAEIRVQALQAAEAARLQDYERYKEFLAVSEALRPVILDLSAGLARSASTVFGTGEFVRPGTGEVTSPFGIRRHPITGVVKLHTGTDLSRGDGYVYAADAGTVVKAEWNRAYGWMTVIDHGRGITTLYAHQATMLVRPGDLVTQGMRMGVVGSTGYSTGPHLHFEVRRDGVPVDPWPRIQDAPMPVGASR